MKNRNKTIIIYSNKGGVGKTSFAVNLAYEAAKQGLSTLFVNTDSQSAAPFFGKHVKPTLNDVICHGLSIDEAIGEVRPNLYLIDSSADIAETKAHLVQMPLGSEKAIRKALEPLLELFDVIIIDTCPSWDIVVIAALMAADELVVPISHDVASIYTIMDLEDNLKLIQEYHDIEINHIVPMFHDKRVSKSEEIYSLLHEEYPNLATEYIPYSVKMSECVGYGKTLFEYDPKNRACEPLRRVARRVLYS